MTTTQHSSAPLMASVSGVRGIVGASLTPGVIARFVGAHVSWLIDHAPSGTTRALVLARDGRAGGEVIAQCAAAACRAAGIRVIDLGVATTPTAGYMVTHHAAAGGLVLTASHNPAEWNGLKPLTSAGRAPQPEEAAEILARFHDRTARWAPAGELGACDADDTAAHAHGAALLRAIEPVCPVKDIAARGYRVALDSVNASGATAGLMLLAALGCEVTPIACEPTGVFPHTPEPTAENLKDLTAAALDAGADVAFAQDPDADRLAIVDDTGRYIGEEFTLVIAADALLGSPAGKGAPAIAANLSTSRMIDDLAAGRGARVVRTPVGEANVVAGMNAASAVLGGEGNGGVIWPEVVEIRDSLVAMALTLALMTREGAPLSAIVDTYPRYAIVKLKAPIREGLAAAAIAALAERYPDAAHDTQDGLRLDFADPPSWLHVRASNTEPILRLIAEAPTAEAAEALAREAQGVIAAL